MKNFLRYTAILFLLVLCVVVVRSLFSPKEDSTPLTQDETMETETTPADEETVSEEDNSEESLEELIDPSQEDDGIIILGGDGIPNN